MTRIGVISDIREFTHNGVKTIADAVKKDINLLVINGNAGINPGQFNAITDALKYKAGGIQIYFQPSNQDGGSTLIDASAGKIDVGQNFTYFKKPSLVKEGDHHLLFIPGAMENLAQGAIEQSTKNKSGTKKIDLDKELSPGIAHDLFGTVKFETQYSNPNDLKNLIKDVDPSRIITFNSVPAFYGCKNSVDSEQFDVINRKKIPIEDVLRRGEEWYRKNDLTPTIQFEGGGSNELKVLYEKNGLNKIISGNAGISGSIFASTHHAHSTNHTLEKDEEDKNIVKYADIKQGEWSDNLALNASWADLGIYSVIEIDKEKIKFEKHIIPDLSVSDMKKIENILYNKYVLKI